MPQTLLHRYFSSSSESFQPSGTSFLDLPVNIRRRIYILAGLVRFCPIDLNLEGCNRHDYSYRDLSTWEFPCDNFPSPCIYFQRRFLGKYSMEEDYFDCVCPPLPYGLLYVSHSISDEVSSILYSENSFKISRSNKWGLKPLRKFSPKALASLRSITIRLKSSSCVIGHDCMHPTEDCACHPLCHMQNLHDKPIGHEARQDKSVLVEWTLLLSKIAVYIRPARLTLTVVCDVTGYKAALLVVEPLSRLPKLKDCAIRLGRDPNPALQNLALQTTCQNIDRYTYAFEPSFQGHLPEEVLVQILGHSDLIAPFDLQWCPDKGLVPFDCCKMCTETLEVCCCSFYHAAYSSRCVCWRVPISIFLVSHRVRELATHIFYTSNHFIILPRSDKDNNTLVQRSSQGELSQFLARLPEYAWKDLRYIQWTSPVFKADYIPPNEDETSGWLNTIDLLSRKADLSRLSIMMDLICDYTWYIPNGEYVLDAQEMVMWTAYQRALKPMVGLKGLLNLFIHINWPRLDQDRYEKKLEELVMGEGYNSAARGKYRKSKLWNDGYSDEGPVFGPDGCEVWPLDYKESGSKIGYY